MTEERISDDEGQSNSWLLQYLKKIDIPTFLAVATIFTWYYVSVSSELFNKTMGIPEQYIEFPFYKLVKVVEPLFLIGIPLAIFIISFLFALLNRILVWKKLRTDTTKKELQLERHVKSYALISVLTIWISMSSIGSRIGLEQFDLMIWLATSVMCVTAVWFFILWARSLWFRKIKKTRNSRSSYSTKAERFFHLVTIIYSILIIYGLILIASVHFYTTSQPQTLTVSKDSVICYEGLCEFEYLISEKNGYSIWSKLYTKIPKLDNERNGQIVLSNSNEELISKRMDGLTMFEIEVDLDWRIDNTSGSTLSIKNWNEFKQQLRLDECLRSKDFVFSPQ